MSLCTRKPERTGAVQHLTLKSGPNPKQLILSKPYPTLAQAPVYEETLEDLGRFNEQPVLPFNAYGTMALARNEFDANSGSSQIFFLLKVSFSPHLEYHVLVEKGLKKVSKSIKNVFKGLERSQRPSRLRQVGLSVYDWGVVKLYGLEFRSKADTP